MADMELVIKIPEEWFDDMVREEFIEVDELCAVIQHGTILPKGHGDLIDRKELLKQPMNTANYPSNYVQIAPTIVEADKENK